MQILTWPCLDWKSLDFQNLDRDKKNWSVDTKDNLDKFQNLVPTQRTILISIGLGCRDPQAYFQY